MGSNNSHGKRSIKNLILITKGSNKQASNHLHLYRKICDSHEEIKEYVRVKNENSFFFLFKALPHYYNIHVIFDT